MQITPDRLDRLIYETRMTGRFFTSGVTHPANYPEVLNIESLNGVQGLRVACDLVWRSAFLFHESQSHRL